jgi:hypothetical protein
MIKRMSVSRKLAILALLTLFSGVAIWVICSPDTPIWQLRTVLHIRSAVDRSLLIAEAPDTKDPAERTKSTTALISTPGFRQTVVDTLRANPLNDYDVTIQFSAAAASDCRQAYRTVVDLIKQHHALLLEQEDKLLQAKIDDYRERSVQLQKWLDAIVQSGSPSLPDPAISRKDLAMAWNETRERLVRLEATKAVLASTSFPSDTEVYVNGPLTNYSVRLSALAGLGLIVSILLLALVLEARTSTRRIKET